jgi:hypothetical protein
VSETSEAGDGKDTVTAVTTAASAEHPATVVFKAACPECRGRFELSATQIRLALGPSDRTTFYSFTCPGCGSAVRKPAGARIVELLTDGGVRTLRLHSTP